MEVVKEEHQVAGIPFLLGEFQQRDLKLEKIRERINTSFVRENKLGDKFA